MGGELLAEHYRKYFSQAQPELLIKEEILEEVIFQSPFLTSEKIFEDILPSVEANEFYSISYIGTQGYGKSSAAADNATDAEDAGFLIIYGKADEILVDLNAWKEEVKKKIKNHFNNKVCFVLDDMSYSTSTLSVRAASKFKNFIADIRHQFEEKDDKGKIIFKPKILMIYISHRYHSLPPILRNSPTWMFVSAQPEDKNDAMKLVPNIKEERQKLEVICAFLQDVTVEGPKSKKFNFHFGKHSLPFVWGTKEDSGDGRLLMIIHQGEIKLYNAKKTDNDIDLEDYRIKIPPKPIPTPEEIEEQKERKKLALKQKAEELFKITEDKIQ